jgi:hypothetical protein
VLVERLTTRTNNLYGKKPDEVAETLRFLQTVEPMLRVDDVPLNGRKDLPDLVEVVRVECSAVALERGIAELACRFAMYVDNALQGSWSVCAYDYPCHPGA